MPKVNPVKEFSITLCHEHRRDNEPVYHTGSKVTGRILLDLLEPITTTGKLSVLESQHYLIFYRL